MNRKLFISIGVISLTVGAMASITSLVWSFQNRDHGAIAYTIALPAKGVEERINMWGGNFTDEDVHCLALNLYFEARGESAQGQHAVAEVVLYRLMASKYPNTICDVVREGRYYAWNPDFPIRHKCQFSWWCDGKSDKPVDGRAFTVALDISTRVLTDPDYEPVMEYALFYHTLAVDPYWVDSVEFVETIGEHSFYR